MHVHVYTCMYVYMPTHMYMYTSTCAYYRVNCDIQEVTVIAFMHEAALNILFLQPTFLDIYTCTSIHCLKFSCTCKACA